MSQVRSDTRSSDFTGARPDLIILTTINASNISVKQTPCFKLTCLSWESHKETLGYLVKKLKHSAVQLSATMRIWVNSKMLLERRKSIIITQESVLFLVFFLVKINNMLKYVHVFVTCTYYTATWIPSYKASTYLI